MPLDEFRDLFDLTSVRAGDFHTLAGLVVTQLGHIPRVGENFQSGGLSFEVVDMDGNRVDRILVKPSAAMTRQFVIQSAVGAAVLEPPNTQKAAPPGDTRRGGPFDPFTSFCPSLFREIIVDFRNVVRPAELNGALVRVFDRISGARPGHPRKAL